MINVELVQGEGGRVDRFMVEDGSSVSALLSRAGVNLDSRKIRINGDSADADTRLAHNDLVMLYQKVAGGSGS